MRTKYNHEAMQADRKLLHVNHDVWW